MPTSVNKGSSRLLKPLSCRAGRKPNGAVHLRGRRYRAGFARWHIAATGARLHDRQRNDDPARLRPVWSAAAERRRANSGGQDGVPARKQQADCGGDPAVCPVLQKGVERCLSFMAIVESATKIPRSRAWELRPGCMLWRHGFATRRKLETFRAIPGG